MGGAKRGRSLPEFRGSFAAGSNAGLLFEMASPIVGPAASRERNVFFLMPAAHAQSESVFVTPLTS